MVKMVRDAGITSIGVYTYTLPDGTTRRDLRKPEEVFKYESLETLRGVPVTLDHPSNESLEKNDFEIYGSVITAGQGWENENLTNIVGNLAIYKDVPDLDSKSLSAGYTCEVELEKGVWCGVEYDAVQKNIKYNHVAIVDKARAGDTTSLKEAHMDSVNGQVATKVEGGAQAPAPAAEAQKPSVEHKADAATTTTVAPAASSEPAKTEETKTVEQKADSAAATTPAQEPAKAPEAPKVETKTDSSDFVTKAEFNELFGLVKGIADSLKPQATAPSTQTVEAKADKADEPKKPVVEVKTDAADKKQAPDDLGRADYLKNFFGQP